MSALPCFNSYAERQYLDVLAEKEAAQDRLNRQVADELRKRDTWVDGLGECALTERPTMPSPVIDALMAGDTAEAGRLIHKYITEVHAVEQAEVSIHRQDEDAENGFYA